jgi:hypothetical protein
MEVNFADQYQAELDRVASTADFCKAWRDKWRGVAVAAQGILKIFVPPGAQVLGFLIAIADTACPTMK